MKKSILSIIIAGIWITVSEFVRNELLFKGYWLDHYRAMGLEFKTLPLNGVFWMIWSFALAYLIFRLQKKFSAVETILLAWLAAFVMMWLTIYNLQVLPLTLLIFAVPLSLFEVAVATFIISKFRNASSELSNA